MSFEYVEQYANMGFRVGYVRIDQVPPHFHNEYEILYAVNDSAEIVLPDGSITFREGECVLVERNLMHMFSAAKSSCSKIVYMNINPNFCNAYCPQFNRVRFSDRLISSKTHPRFHRALQDFLLLYFQEAFQPSASTNLRLMSSLATLCSLMLTELNYVELQRDEMIAQEAIVDRLMKILNYTAENHTRKITLSEISKSFNLDLYYLSHYIKESIGMSFQQYLSRIRMYDAICQMKIDPTKRLADISADAGFSDLRYCNKAFQEGFQCSATEYRAMALQSRAPTLLAEEISYPFPKRGDISGYASMLVSELQRHQRSALECK